MKTMVEDASQPQLAGDLRADYAEVAIELSVRT